MNKVYHVCFSEHHIVIIEEYFINIPYYGLYGFSEEEALHRYIAAEINFINKYDIFGVDSIEVNFAIKRIRKAKDKLVELTTKKNIEKWCSYL